MLEKKFDPSAIEKKYIDKWAKSNVVKASPSSSATPFTVMMPPPNVTGHLHMGHALNMTLQDVLTRYFRMKGQDALWQPGMDHAGIATQMVVERNLEAEGRSRKTLGREKFVERVWEWKEQSGGTIGHQLQRLGTTPDWSRERFTMDDGLSKAVTKVFVQLYNEGLIYRDKRLVNWDPKFQTAISDLEVQHKEVKGKLYHVKYPLEDGSGHVSIATTRPETILADGAVAVHPDDKKYKDLVGKCVVVPVCDRIIPIIADEYVKSEFGSGAVKITPAHDYNDFEVYKRHQDKEIVLVNLMTPDGKMNENCPDEYQGLDRFEARKKIISDLEDLEYLERVENHVHQVPYGDRSGVVIEPYLTDQWFVDAQTLAQPAIEAVRTGNTRFVPKQWENTYFSWMENIQPWCVSRQLWWGHQIPAWYGPDGRVFVAEKEADATKEATEFYGKEVALKRDEDVLDTWFSSALWPFSTLGWPDDTSELRKYYPGNVLITGFDIIFFWVCRMMMFGIHFMGTIPFKEVYIHALVRDSKGQKMSKSKGNIIDPLDLIDKFGADALRFTLLALAAQGRDIKMSEDRVEGYRNFATKLWNAARYCQINGCFPDETFDPRKAEDILNRWIIGEVADVKKKIENELEAYRFNEAASAIYHFVWHTFCDWYLEFTKPVLSGEDSKKDNAEETQKTTAWVLDQILVLLNPFMPFITEELYLSMGQGNRDRLLLETSWPEYEDDLSDGKAADDMGWLINAISEVRSVRADMNVPAGAQITLLISGADEQTKKRVHRFEDIIKRLARLETISSDASSFPKGTIQTVVGEALFALPVADIIDLEKESTRLQKEIEKLNGEIKRLAQKLGNDQFVQNAPEDVVEEQRRRKAEAEQTLDKLNSALDQLKAA